MWVYRIEIDSCKDVYVKDVRGSMDRLSNLCLEEESEQREYPWRFV